MMNLNEITTALKNKEEIKYASLTGSEKQIKWATKLKKEMVIGSIADIDEEVEDWGWDDEDVIDEIKDFMDLVNEVSASTIIEWHVR